MSRPPRPHFHRSTAGVHHRRRDQLHYLPCELGDFVQLEKELAAAEAGLGSRGAEGDFSATLMEASAVLGHLLGRYQDLYAREAYLPTASSPRSLVYHARRLAYEPDQGLSATGHAALTVGEGLAGTVEAGFGLASVPQGEVKAQDYETLSAVEVRAEWNELLPSQATRRVRPRFDNAGKATLRLAGIGYGFEPGEHVLFCGYRPKYALVVAAARELADQAATELDVAGGPASTSLYGDFRLLARPEVQLHPFAWNVDSAQRPPEDDNDGIYRPPNLDPAQGTIAEIGDTSYGYGKAPDSRDVFLDREVPEPLLGSWVIHAGNGAPYQVIGEILKPVSLKRGEVIAIPEPLFAGDGKLQIAKDGTIMRSETKQVVETQISGTVTTLRLQNTHCRDVLREQLAFPSKILTGFELEVPLADSQPNPRAVSQPVRFLADLTALEPGRFLVLSNDDGTKCQVVRVEKVETEADSGDSLLYWSGSGRAESFRLDDFKVLANVAEIAHGKSKTEILGGSDGVTPFLSFVLREAPTSQLPGAGGGEPAIEVRVHAVRWQRVADFSNSGPEDRHYRIEIDPRQTTAVVFGDGKNGAIPPSGKKHITAAYKVGLGAAGNAGAGRINRIKKAHPLIERAWNPTPVRGGAAPADPEDLRRQATRYVRTFDRAVSVQDHADLALLFPGVARAAANWTDAGGIELVVADAGGEPADRAAVTAFLAQRRDTTVPLQLVDPEPVDIHLAVTVEHDPAYFSEKVKIAVQEALYGRVAEAPGMFTFAGRDFGQPAYLSEVYARIDRVPGVEHVKVTFFALAPPAPESPPDVRDVLTVSPIQWLRLAPNPTAVRSIPRSAP